MGTWIAVLRLRRDRDPLPRASRCTVFDFTALGDADFVERSRQHNEAELARFVEAVQALGNHGLRAVPSKANFLLVLFEGALTAEAAREALAEGGYAVRHLPGQGLGQALRITIGTGAQMDEISAILRWSAEALSAN